MGDVYKIDISMVKQYYLGIYINFVSRHMKDVLVYINSIKYK